MKVTELREMTLDELRGREGELEEEVARMRLQLSLKRLDNPLKIRTAKRDLARVKTIIGERLRATNPVPNPERREVGAEKRGANSGSESGKT